MKKLLLITACLFTISSSVFAQHMSPAQQGFAHQQQMRMRQRQQQQNQIAQQRRQQAYNNRMRNKKWYGAIVADIGGFSYGTSTGYSSKNRAIKAAFKRCTTNRCKILATFANTCATVAAPNQAVSQMDNQFLAFDGVGQNAIIKAVRACEAVYGNSPCSFLGVGNNRKEALCSGYEYGHYGRR